MEKDGESKVIPPLSQGPSEKLRKNVAPSRSFVPYLQPGSLLSRPVQPPPGSFSLEALAKGEFWPLRKLKAALVLKQMCLVSCVQCEPHRKDTCQESRAVCCPVFSAHKFWWDESQQCHPSFSSREGSNGPVWSPPPIHH